MVDSVPEGVLEARLLHRALVADLACRLDSDPVTGEEDRRVFVCAQAVGHPFGGHDVSSVSPLLTNETPERFQDHAIYPKFREGVIGWGGQYHLRVVEKELR